MVMVKSFLSRSTVSKVPFPSIPPRIPGECSWLPRTGLSSFTLLAASPISSQKLPNSSLESCQLPDWCCSLPAHVLGRKWGSSWIPEPSVGQLFLPPSTEHWWRFLMRTSVARSMSLNSWASSAWADRHSPRVPSVLGPLVRVCRPAACPGEADGL